jgi:hypothetical protein
MFILCGILVDADAMIENAEQAKESVSPPAAAFGHSRHFGRHPRGTDENRAASPSTIVGWVRIASRIAV